MCIRDRNNTVDLKRAVEVNQKSRSKKNKETPEMTFTPLTLDLNEYGILSGQLYQPEVHSVGQLEQSANFQKDARLVILLHGWGADGSGSGPTSAVFIESGICRF